MALSIKPYIENKERIHLIGIGGVSMNSLAELLLSKGVPVSGSDRLRTDVTARLEALGASITYEHRPENVEGASLIVRTAAVHDENPEIVRAHELGIPVMERAEAWGHIMRDYDNVVCLSGTHGKTTSTSMMTMMTIEAQMDPTVMVGSNLPAIGGTLRIGGKGCFVAESCEYTNSFLRFAPTVSVILNVEEDHLDFFKDINDIIHSFHEFAELTPMNGLVVVNHDDPNAMRAVAHIDRPHPHLRHNARCRRLPDRGSRREWLLPLYRQHRQQGIRKGRALGARPPQHAQRPRLLRSSGIPRRSERGCGKGSEQVHRLLPPLPARRQDAERRDGR